MANPSNIHYSDGDIVHAGDWLSPGREVNGQCARVVLVVPAGEAVAGYDPGEWTHLRDGILVENTGANGLHLIHYPQLDDDIELLRRS